MEQNERDNNEINTVIVVNVNTIALVFFGNRRIPAHLLELLT